ncbi:hemicentin-1-like [Hoplias malabaricus]|uniref:hemicentin-1-like n=1 Tax=Hoplias malabaricus TaxID=27720 RepID=UPI00346255C7
MFREGLELMAARALCRALSLLLFAGVCLGQQLALPPEQNRAVGEKVEFKPTTVPPPPYSLVTWIFGGVNIYLVAGGGSPVIAPGYEERVSFNSSTLALELRSLTIADNGEYHLNVQTKSLSTAKTTLKVFVPVSNVTVTQSESELIEFNSTVHLTCSASGSSLKIFWLNGSSEVTVGGGVLTDGNRTLTIVNVSRYDKGPFTCDASNVISNNKSQPLVLSIYYGPDNASLTAHPMTPHHSSGSNLTLKCSAKSSPEAEFQWALNGTGLSLKGPQLKLTNIQINQSGSYTCTAHNTKSLRYSTSEPISITVLEKLSGARMTLSPDLPKEGVNASLTAEVHGTITSTKWMKDNKELPSSNRITFSYNKSILTFSPLKRTDSGLYQCVLSSLVSSETVEYTMKVIYGPDFVKIEAPVEVEESESVTLGCVAESVPEAVYSWAFNATSTNTNTTGYSFKVEQAKFSDSGNYTCTALNNVTGKYVSGSHFLVVRVKGSLRGTLSPGAIAGIVIAVLLGIAFVIIYFKIRRSKLSVPTHETMRDMRPCDLTYPEINGEHVADGAFRHDFLENCRRGPWSLEGVLRACSGGLSHLTSASEEMSLKRAKVWPQTCLIQPFQHYTKCLEVLRVTPERPVNKMSSSTSCNVCEGSEIWFRELQPTANSLIHPRPGVCFGQQLALPPELNGAVGEKVEFKPTTVPPPPYSLVSWIIGGVTIYLVAGGGSPVIVPGYEDRVSFNSSTLALELRNLMTADNGDYHLTVQTNTQVTARTTLKVFVPVFNVTVTQSELELIEFNSTVHLTCSASGSSPMFFWLNGSSEVTVGGGVILTNANRTLTIVNVSRYDKGPFTCEAFNVISNNRSQPLNFNIYYGPDSASLTAHPMTPHHSSGSDLTLNCSANSSPEAEFQWALNGTGLSLKGPQLKLTNIQLNQSGNYTCTAHNTKSLRYSTSEPISITVLEKISGATIIFSPGFKIEGFNTSLTSNANGSITSIKWTKDNQGLSSSNSITFSDNNSTVRFSPVMRTDSGRYRCNLSNPISFDTVDYFMTVIYGPDDVNIKAPVEVEEGQSVTLECVADSVPEAVYTWEFNSTKTEVNTTLFTVKEAKFSDSGNYTCTAFNDVTRHNTSGSHFLVVKEKGTVNPGLSPGAIAGIVIGVLLGLIVITGLIIYFKKFKGGSRENNQNGATQNGGEYDMNYAEIQHKKNNPSVENMRGPNTQMRPGTPGMLRAESGGRTSPKPEVIYTEVKK